MTPRLGSIFLSINPEVCLLFLTSVTMNGEMNFLQVTFCNCFHPCFCYLQHHPPTKSGKKAIMLFTKTFLLTTLGLTEYCFSSAGPQDPDAFGQSMLPKQHDQPIPFGSLHLNPHWKIQWL